MNDQVSPLPAAGPAPSGALSRKRPQSVLVVVCTQAGEFLLLRRVWPPGFWQSITGSLNPGETPRQAAARELWEETGLRAGGALIDLRQSTLFPIIPRWRHRYAPNVCFNREYRFALILPSRRLVRINPREHSAYRWLKAAEAAALTGSWTNRAAIEQLAASLPRGEWATPSPPSLLPRRQGAAGEGRGRTARGQSAIDSDLSAWIMTLSLTAVF